MAAFLGAFLFVSVVVAQNNCSITPIYVDFHDRAVDGGVSEQYGLFTGIGNPTSQNLSLWPSFSNNETTVGSLEYCADSPFGDCISQSHGYYEPALSEAYSSDSSYQSLDNLGSIPASIVETATDTFNLFTHYFDPSPPNISRVPDFPVTVLSNYSSTSTPWFGPAGLLGLGPDSTILRHLYDLKLISSRSWGLYMGTAYVQSNGAINGSLTLGGYDSGRFAGEVYDFPVSPAHPDAGNSPFMISIAQMTLTTADGDTTDLLTESFEAHLTTAQHHLNLPDAVTQRFADEAGASPSNDDLNVLRLPDDFDSTLTIAVQGGLNITYESDWLRNVSNNSPISAASSTANANSTNSTINLFGTAFLSNIYMMANYDSDPPTFHLASARPHGPYVMTKTFCANTIPTPAPETKVSSFARAGLTGAIVGGVVGGIGLGFLVYWLFRKYMQRRMWSKEARAAMKGKGVDAVTVAKGKGSPSSFSGDDERDSAEMATFAFDLNSQQHPAYASYLKGQGQGQGQDSAPLHDPAMKESKVTTQTQPHSTSESDYAAAQSYHRALDDAYSYSSPLTPATGVPLLLSQQAPARSSLSVHNSSAFAPLTLTHSNASFSSETSFAISERKISSSSSDSASTRGGPRQLPVPLNVRTEFAPPPTSERVARKAVGVHGGKKESLLRKVFPPPPRGL